MNRRLTFPRLAAFAWVALAAASRLAPAGVGGDGFTFCLFRALTGVPCPGCGMGHALLHGFRGEWAASWAAHPLGLPLLALWTAWLGWGGLNACRGRGFVEGLSPALARPAIGAALLGLVLGTYALRWM